MSCYKIKFNPKSHRRYLLGILHKLPSCLSSLDTQRCFTVINNFILVYLFFFRVLLVYFSVSGLDLLNELDRIPNKQAIIEWLYSLQVVDDTGKVLNKFQKWCFLRGSCRIG